MLIYSELLRSWSLDRGVVLFADVLVTRRLDNFAKLIYLYTSVCSDDMVKAA